MECPYSKRSGSSKADISDEDSFVAIQTERKDLNYKSGIRYPNVSSENLLHTNNNEFYAVLCGTAFRGTLQEREKKTFSRIIFCNFTQNLIRFFCYDYFNLRF